VNARLDIASVRRFQDLVAHLLGLHFDSGRLDELERVLERRAAACGVPVVAYLEQLARLATRAELAALVEELTITETYFYRHSEQIQALAEAALPARRTHPAIPGEWHLLSVGCSSGEEAYTLAMVALGARPTPQWQVFVHGVDANGAALRKAAAARYSAWALRETPPRIRQECFQRRGNEFQVSQAVRERVTFTQHNLAEDDPRLWRPGQYDVIFCRNLLMYLRQDVAAQLVARMTGALAPGGALFLGHTDTLGARPAGLAVKHSHDAFYYERLPADQGAAAAAGPGRTEPPVTAPAATVLPPPSDRHLCDYRLPPGANSAVVQASTAPPRPGAHWRQVIELIQRERFAEALTAIAAVTTAERAVPLVRALLLLQTGQQAEATSAVRELLVTDGGYADAHHLLAMCLEDSDPAAAEQRYRLATGLDPDFAMPWLRLGLLSRQRGSLGAERWDLERAITLLPAESDQRILFFGGGFGRHALLTLCRSELDACGSRR